jgi:hypothetical protein
VEGELGFGESIKITHGAKEGRKKKTTTTTTRGKLLSTERDWRSWKN